MPAKQTVVLCDDDEGILEVARIVLEDKGYRVVTCLDCEEIFKKIEKEKPAVVLLDLWMPKQGGDEITKILKSREETKNIPVIIVSASKDAVHVAKEVGADGCLCKPFDIEELETKVASCIRSAAPV